MFFKSKHAAQTFRIFLQPWTKCVWSFNYTIHVEASRFMVLQTGAIGHPHTFFSAVSSSFVCRIIQPLPVSWKMWSLQRVLVRPCGILPSSWAGNTPKERQRGTTMVIPEFLLTTTFTMSIEAENHIGSRYCIPDLRNLAKRSVISLTKMTLKINK